MAKIAVNTRILNTPATGIHSYIRNLYKALQDLECDHRYYVLKPTSQNYFWSAFFDLFNVNKVASERRIKILHGPAHILPVFRTSGLKYVVTVHDLAFLISPEQYPKIFELYYRFAVRIALKNADRIIAISENTKKDIVTFFKVDPKNIDVVPLGVSKVFFTDTKEKRVVSKQYFLSVTTHPKRKNVVNVLRAIQNSERLKEYQYVIAGLIEEKQKKELLDHIKELGLEYNVLLRGYVTLNELISLYQHAEFLIYPSFYEGFGLPVLEAMACGCPVITSNTSSLTEVMVDDQWLVDPYSFENIAEKMEKLSFLTESEREELKSKNLAFASNFTWEKTARGTLKSFENVLNE